MDERTAGHVIRAVCDAGRLRAGAVRAEAGHLDDGVLQREADFVRGDRESLIDRFARHLGDCVTPPTNKELCAVCFAGMDTSDVRVPRVQLDRAPGARRLYEVRNKIVDTNATCVFAEPQFEPGLVATVVEGTGAQAGVLDPLGASLTPGPDAYFTLLENLADSLRDCLLQR